MGQELAKTDNKKKRVFDREFKLRALALYQNNGNKGLTCRLMSTAEGPLHRQSLTRWIAEANENKELWDADIEKTWEDMDEGDETLIQAYLLQQQSFQLLQDNMVDASPETLRKIYVDATNLLNGNGKMHKTQIIEHKFSDEQIEEIKQAQLENQRAMLERADIVDAVIVEQEM